MLNPITRDQLLPKGFVPDAPTIVLLDEAVELDNEVQDFVQRQCTPTSGLRTIDDYLRLKRNGYNPSASSDHFYGLAVPVQANNGVASGTIGATDLYIPGLKTLFGHIVNYFLTKYPNPVDRPRQMIYETGPNGDWLHIANVPSRVLSPKMALAKLHPTPILYSLDNGKSYHAYDSKNPPSELATLVPIVPLPVTPPVVEKPVEATEKAPVAVPSPIPPTAVADPLVSPTLASLVASSSPVATDVQVPLVASPPPKKSVKPKT